MPHISTIIPVYNGAAYLAESVKSALAQDFADQEIIIVNDGSTDDSGQIADTLARQHPSVSVIHQANGGPCSARNSGIAVARGELIALLDADDLWLPNHLKDCVVHFSSPNVGLVHTHVQIINHDGSLKPVEIGRWSSSTDPWRAVFLRNEHVTCTTTVFRRDLFVLVGGFDMAFNRLGAEDRDLWLRMLSVTEAVYIDSVHALYRLHSSNSSKALRKMLDARVLLIKKHSNTNRGKDLKRKALSATYADAGLEFRSIRQYGAALAAFSKSLTYDPINGRTLKAALGAMCLKT